MENTDAPVARRDRLQHAIEHAAHLLPAQGPITVFIHHNTLHAFEDLPFDEGVQNGARIFGCQPYLSEDNYRDKLQKGRIRVDDLEWVLRKDLGERAGEPVLKFCSRYDLRLAMLQYPLSTGPTEELLWYVAETDALRQVRSDASAAARGRLISETRHWVMRDLRGGQESLNGSAHRGSESKGTSRRAGNFLADLFERFGESGIETWERDTWEAFALQALWRVCGRGAQIAPAPVLPAPPPARHRDVLLAATSVDADAFGNDLLIRYTAAFLDQGFAHWPLPDRDKGYYESFLSLYRRTDAPVERWMRGLARELARLQDGRVGPLDSISESLAELGVPEAEWEDFLSTALLSLRGWGGMVHQVEIRGDRVAQPVPAGSLVEFLAVRLLLDRWAYAHVARAELQYKGPLAELRDAIADRARKPAPPASEQRAFLVFQLAQLFGWTPEELHRLSADDWGTLFREIESFAGIERRRVFHAAFESRFRTQTLDALALHARKPAPPVPAVPRFQAMFCLDEREESFRRHLEELVPDVETFGAAGFYSVAMYYRGAADAHYVPLCPIVIRPQHWVKEEVEPQHAGTHKRRVAARRAIGALSHRFHAGTRSFVLGSLIAGGVGFLASIPLVARILFPRLTSRLRQRFTSVIQTPTETRLTLERTAPAPAPEDGCLGYSLDEMTNIGERLLRDIGLVTRFSRVVLIVGHGSNSLNNPHNSAYMCGACGGSAGGPNARALAQVLNDARVRERLVGRGVAVPADTVFVGGYHNTCNDEVTFLDTDKVPATHAEDVAFARRSIAETCKRNAHERCRRFMSAPLTMSYSAAKRHVEARSEDLGQTRPECGHATNAIAVVGRRPRTRGLYLDRRAFLVSYDPTRDDATSSILTRTLQAVFPVCGGINLEYYFSYVDSPGFGCGTKLPHNVASLLGVMDGAASDLRTGLPWQMVEIHEPVRLLFVIETTPEAMLQIIEKNEGIGRMCRNGWVQLAVLDPGSDAIQVFRNGTFHPYEPVASELPRAASSVDWYRGWRDHLEFAEIGPESVKN
ncbi:DUF2309 domain-containing protein [Fimbriiglobus ruber]|uniref:Probable inorganic carbon transporter subunit DabA n=1 Tax=Fimbriiglobus ruber TaxID=1908690 RepID=A0A225D7Y3_9BACT|nr:DUF2309 domain-containing protein [Fimbriiglobus ruber]OWK37671.1 putative transmembrane protein [Fimbriiglobus ruber]